MVYGAIDLHMQFSQIRIVDAEGKMLRERRVLTTRERLVAATDRCGSWSKPVPRASGWPKRSKRWAMRWWSPIPITGRCMERCSGA